MFISQNSSSLSMLKMMVNGAMHVQAANVPYRLAHRPAPGMPSLQLRRDRGVRCSRFVRQSKVLHSNISGPTLRESAVTTGRVTALEI